MYALASNLVTVLRGTTTNRFGDEIDDPDNSLVVARAIPAQITVASSRGYDRTSQQVRVIQTITAAVQSDTDIVEEDQLVDDQTGTTYIVETVTQPGGPGFTGDLELVLRRVI